MERLYDESECLWGLSPDQILIENIEKIPKGKALDLGVGEGRNALYLANAAFHVTGIDVLPKAIEKYLSLAKERGLSVKGLVMDIRDYDFECDVYSLVVASTTLHFLRKSEVYEIVPKIIGSIVAGGYVYIKDFTVDDPSYNNAKERLKQVEENTFYSTKLSSYIYFFLNNELKKMFKDCEIKSYKEETIIDLDHGKTGPHKHGVVRLFAKKRNE